MLSCQSLFRRRIHQYARHRPLRFLGTSASDKDGNGDEDNQKRFPHEKLVVDDAHPISTKQRQSKRLPTMWSSSGSNGKREFPVDAQGALRQTQATGRILKIATDRLIEPPTLQLLAFSALAAIGIAGVEATILCQEWPLKSADSTTFMLLYSVQQLIPSCVWETQDAALVVRSLGMDPDIVLRELSGLDAESASVLLRTKLLRSTRYLVAGFMMIAQLVRAAGVSAGALSEYEERIRLGREPPLPLMPSNPGMVVRLSGQASYVTEVSLEKMGPHLFPVFENPERVQYLVWKHSERKRTPLYWCVREKRYGSAFSWDRFPSDESSLILADDGSTKLLILEADATNGNDPLSLSNKALDLTIDDASQGFRRIQERYADTCKFQTFRVFLGNSMEIGRTGGGHSYTLRHRIRYAKEVDVLLDSRAPVLQRILDWCNRVARKDRKIFFQTSSREYFLNIQQLLKEYGYEIYDPLDVRMSNKGNDVDEGPTDTGNSFMNVLLKDPSFLETVWDDREILNEYASMGAEENKDDTKKSGMLREVTKLAQLPRLVHMETTAETVNAVEALVTAGEVDAMNCCALMDRQEGVVALESILDRKSKLVKSGKDKHEWIMEDLLDEEDEEDDKEEDEDDTTVAFTANHSGLQIICSSSIHDKLFRQVRIWARMGYSASDIQKEMDMQFYEILKQSHETQKEVEMATKEEKSSDEATDTPPEDVPPPEDEASCEYSEADPDDSKNDKG